MKTGFSIYLKNPNERLGDFIERAEDLTDEWSVVGAATQTTSEC